MNTEGTDIAAPEKPAPSIGGLLRRLIEEIGDLFRAELRVVRSEVTGNIASARGGAVAIAIGGVFMTGALLAFLGAAVGWLAPHVGVGWAAFIVGAASAVFGAVAISAGVASLRSVKLSPDRTMARLKRDAEALKGDD